MNAIDQLFDDLEWEATQNEIVQKVSESEKNGWGYSRFKSFLRAKLAHLSEEELVSGYQVYLLQKNFSTPLEWAPFYYDEWFI